jgi:hypothetical protein
MEHAQKKKASKPYSPEFRERAVRLVAEQRKHVGKGMLSPIDFEQQQKLKLQGVYKSKGHSGP